MYRTIFIKNLNDIELGKLHKLAGWINNFRIHSKTVFLDLRDEQHHLQCVLSRNLAMNALLDQCKHESFISITGKLRLRDIKYQTSEPMGQYEFLIEDLTVHSVAKVSVTPAELAKSNLQVKFRQRYIDLRHYESQQALLLRSKLTRFVHNFFQEHEFTHVETPLLTKSTPEGARDFLVFSRVYPGQAYALPQSPQLYKQLLMMSGIHKYYQLARCFRDEDIRADRQAEFTQLDLELSCCEQEDVLDIVSEFIISAVQEFGHTALSTIPRMHYQEAISLYGTDKPDVSINGLHFKHINKEHYVMELADHNILDHARYLNDQSYGSNAKIEYDQSHKSFVGYGPLAGRALADIRRKLGVDLGLKLEGLHPVWVTNFPMFEQDINNNITTLHHPFTKTVNRLDPANWSQAESCSFDLVINGEEVGGGSIRETNPEGLYDNFKLLGYSESYIEDQFGFFLQALNSGVPPHGGFAFGFDRLIMLLQGERDIRNVIAFPKNQSGRCYVTQAPSLPTEEQLTSLGLLCAKPPLSEESLQ